ncbi:MAG: hypothetical protein MN733_28340 [Nitrososphaera sp.]|nr:hypothetical protein [Nitrososphaera sp.]
MNRGWAVAEAIADQHGVIIHLFLMDRNADLVFGEELHTSSTKVDYRTIRGAAE